jgi:UDP-N-acetylenolpyruvoylglucosamine reductase
VQRTARWRGPHFDGITSIIIGQNSSTCIVAVLFKLRPYILKSEVQKAIKEMKHRKATGDDDVPGDVLKLL